MASKEGNLMNMKRILLTFVLALGSLALAFPEKAQASSCFASIPDSAWGPQNPRGNHGQPDAVMTELRGPSGNGNQTLILKKVELVSNSSVVNSSLDIRRNNPQPSVVNDVLRGNLTLYTLKSDHQSNSVNVGIRFVYSGLNCDERTVTVPGSIRIEYKMNLIPFSDSRAITRALLAAYPSYDFASAQSDYDQRLLPFFKQYVNSESNPIRVTNPNFALPNQVFTTFGPGGNSGSGYYIVSNDNCISGDIKQQISNNVFNGYNFGYTTFPVPLPSYFFRSSSTSGSAIVPTARFNQEKCRLQILLPLVAPTSNYQPSTSPYFVSPEAPTFVEGFVWVQNGLRDAEIKAAAEAAEKAAAELKVKQEADAKMAADLKSKLDAETKAMAELKAKQEAELTAKAATLRKTTINCVKGKVVRKVMAIKPKCPSGFKIKK